jgi:pilus assembly protein FimV
MEKQCLKKLVRGANKKVADGGDELIAQAENAGWAGEVEEIVSVLNKHRHLFTDEFDEQLPSLEQHLSTRSEDNLKATSEVIHQRLLFLQKEFKAEQEEAKGVTETELSAPIGGAEEDDFASLLDQKSVDEMSESEMDAVTVGDVLEQESEALGDVSEDLGLEEEDAQADDEPEVNLDDLLAAAEQEKFEETKSQPIPATVSEDDFASLLDQKSVDEMSEEEMETLRPKEEEPAAELEEPSEPEASESDDLDSLLADADAAEPEESSEPEASESDNLDSLLSDADADEPEEPSEPEASESDDLDSLLADADAAEPEEPSEPEASESDDLDSLLSDADAVEPEPSEPEASESDDLDSLLSDADATEPEDLSEPETSESDDLDSLLSDAAEPEDSSEPENIENNEEEVLEEDSDLNVSDVLDGILEEAGLDSEENESEDSLLDAFTDPLESNSEEDANMNNDLDSLLDELDEPQGESLIDSMDSAEDHSDVDDLISEIAEETEIDGSEDMLAGFTAESEEADELLDELASASENGDLLDELSEDNYDGTTAMLNALQEESKITHSDSEVEEILADVESDLSDSANVLDVLGSLSEDGDSSEDEEEEDENMLSNLLSEATGRQISMDDLEAETSGDSVSLSELVRDAEDSLEDDVTEHVRILSASFRLEKAGEVIYAGSDEKEAKKLIAESIFSGESAELKLIKICRKEIVKIVSEELPISVSIKA